MLVTPSHQVPERPQDAMAVWVEDLTQSSFKICLREVKIFDGFHQNIKVVSNFDSAFLLLNSKFFTLKQVNPTKMSLLNIKMFSYY